MAVNLNIKDQGIALNAPSEGQVFKSGGTVAIIKDGKIYQLDSVIDPRNTNNVRSPQALFEKTFGAGAFQSLPEFQLGEVEQIYRKIGKPLLGTEGVGASIKDLPQGEFTLDDKTSSFFNPSQNTNSGLQSFVQNISPNNPNGAQITDLQGNIIKDSRTVQEVQNEARLANSNQILPAQMSTLASVKLPAVTSVSAPKVALQPGATGKEVKQLQDYLVGLGLMTKDQVATGYGTYGPQTTEAVRKLQEQLGVDNSSGPGYFGPKTIASLGQYTPNVSDTRGGLPEGGGQGGAINISGLSSPSSPYNMPQPNINTGTANALTAGAKAYSAELEKANQAVASTQQQYDGLSSEIQKLLGETVGRGAAQGTADIQFGVQEKRQKLADLNATLQTGLAEYEALKGQYEALNVDVEGKPITMSSIIGAQAQVNRQAAVALNRKASEIGLIQAQMAGVQGQLDTAVSLANRAVDLKYQDDIDLLNVKIQQLDLIRDDLSVKQKEQALIREQEYREQMDAIEIQRTYEKANYSQLLNWMNQYPDAGVSVNDSLATAQSKVANSASYKAEVGKNSNKSIPNDLNQQSQPVKKYSNDLDAIIGTVNSTIPTKFGQETFSSQISKARDDEDRINLVAAQVLKGQPAEFKNDFRNQAVGVSLLDKAIAEIDKGVQTGVLNSGLQYTYNLVGRDFDPKLAKIEGYITSAIQPYRNSVTGAAWGEQEDGEYQSLFGSTKYSPTELRQRLVQTKELLKSKSAEGLNSFVNPLGYYDNAFESGGLSPTDTTKPQNNDELVFDEVVGTEKKIGVGGYISNLWSALWGK